MVVKVFTMLVNKMKRYKSIFKEDINSDFDMVAQHLENAVKGLRVKKSEHLTDSGKDVTFYGGKDEYYSTKLYRDEIWLRFHKKFFKTSDMDPRSRIRGAQNIDKIKSKNLKGDYTDAQKAIKAIDKYFTTPDPFKD